MTQFQCDMFPVLSPWVGAIFLESCNRVKIQLTTIIGQFSNWNSHRARQARGKEDASFVWGAYIQYWEYERLFRTEMSRNIFSQITAKLRNPVEDSLKTEVNRFLEGKMIKRNGDREGNWNWGRRSWGIAEHARRGKSLLEMFWQNSWKIPCTVFLKSISAVCDFCLNRQNKWANLSLRSASPRVCRSFSIVLRGVGTGGVEIWIVCWLNQNSGVR